MPLVTDDKGNPPRPQLPKPEFTIGVSNLEEVINTHHDKDVKSSRKSI